MVLLVGAVLFGTGFGLLQNATLIPMMGRVSKSEYGLGSTLWNAAWAGTGREPSRSVRDLRSRVLLVLLYLRGAMAHASYFRYPRLFIDTELTVIITNAARHTRHLFRPQPVPAPPCKNSPALLTCRAGDPGESLVCRDSEPCVTPDRMG